VRGGFRVSGWHLLGGGPHQVGGVPQYVGRRECRVFEVSFADHFSAAQDMARELVTPRGGATFPGGMVWLYGRDHWPVADYTLTRFRRSYGIEAALDDEPVLLVGADEPNDAVAAMALMMTYGADCFFVAADASYMVLSCDENILTLVAADDVALHPYVPLIEALEFTELTGPRNTFCMAAR
jgi:hypothetical protein